MLSPTGYRHTTQRVQLFSGGLDSLAIWFLHDRPQPLYVSLGHRYQLREVEVIANLSIELTNAGIPFSPAYANRLTLGDIERGDGYIPLRNLLLAQVAHLEFPQAETIILGALRGEASRDKSGRFLRDTSRTLSYLSNGCVRVVAPARGVTKAGLVRQFVKRYPEQVHFLRMTRSCYSATELADDCAGCGQCQACVRRWVAMSSNGIHEQYITPPHEYAMGMLATADGNRSWLKAFFAADWHEWGNLLINNARALVQVLRQG